VKYQLTIWLSQVAVELRPMLEQVVVLEDLEAP
jgi:hypothetical protein